MSCQQKGPYQQKDPPLVMPTKGPTTCHANKMVHHLSCQQRVHHLSFQQKCPPLVIPTKWAHHLSYQQNGPTTCHSNKMGPPLVIPTNGPTTCHSNKRAHHLSYQQNGPTTCHTNTNITFCSQGTFCLLTTFTVYYTRCLQHVILEGPYADP